MDNSWIGTPYKEFEFKGYHTEISGNGYDLLVRDEDYRVIAKYEGDYYVDDIIRMTTGAYKDTDYAALKHFYEWCN